MNFVAPYEKGWARLKPGEGLVASQTSKDFPPDRPPTATYRTFPDSQVAPFPWAQSSHRQARCRGSYEMSARRIIAAALLLGLAAPAFAQADITSRVAAYKQRVQLLEDQDAIENLQATYGYYFDKGLWDQAAALFTRTGSFEYGQRGVYIGSAHIQKAMLLFGPQGLAAGHLNTHMMLQPYIVVAKDGKTATARWQGMMMLSQPGANGVWGVGVTNADYVKEAGVWKISSLHFYVTAQTDYDLGFTKSALPVEGRARSSRPTSRRRCSIGPSRAPIFPRSTSTIRSRASR